MNATMPTLLIVATVAFAPQSAAQKTNQPEKPVVNTRVPVDVSLQGLGDPSTIGLTATTSCLDSIQDRGSGGNCLMASSTPTFGLLYPLGPEFNIDAAGNVGIGTTTPTTKLDVAGTLTLDPSGDKALLAEKDALIAKNEAQIAALQARLDRLELLAMSK